MSASGLKNGRADGQGENRQEGAKPWRRNVPGEASSGEVDLLISNVLKGTKPHERHRKAAALIAVACWWSSSVGGVTP
jgi:hypothetical protein